MQPLTIKDIVAATGGTLVCGDKEKEIKYISTDSRNLTSDTLFVPIKGERFDGHDFLDSADMFITEKKVAPSSGKCIIETGNTVEAFGKIAKYYKEQYPIKTVSVVGSVGKTTTRDMVAAVLSQKYNTIKTEKNYNNNIGVPIMVTKIEKENEIAVLELGMSALGEIEYLADIVRPNVLVMTNIGKSHIENLGTQDNIFKAKMEGTTFMTENDTVVANSDDRYLKTVAEYGNYKTLFYAIENEKADIRAVNINNLGLNGTEFDIVYKSESYHAQLNIAGIHNIYNALAAFGAGVVCGVEPSEILKGLSLAEFTAMRMEISEHYGVKIINDCYNASPDSMKAALKVLSQDTQRRRVAVLGDMLELGEYSLSAHKEVGKFAVENADVLVCVGPNAKYIADGADGMKHIITFEDTDKAVCEINTVIMPNDIVLLKASRGMHFEKIFKELTKERN